VFWALLLAAASSAVNMWVTVSPAGYVPCVEGPGVETDFNID
jgi:hypothetical protein